MNERGKNERGELMSIGRFGRLSGLSIGALRHYDEVGLMRPAWIDPANGYRRYRSDQIERARTIARLRELEVPLDEIGPLLDAPDHRARTDRLARHRARMEARLARQQRLLHHIRQITEHEEALMSRPQTPPDIDPDTERQLASGLFNYTWTLLEREDRSADEVDRMIHAAHASAYHWGRVGSTANRARGEWICSRVYAILGRGEPAVWHARRCLQILEAGGQEVGQEIGNGIEDWDRPAAYEALARAHAVASDRTAVEHWRSLARESVAQISDPEGRELIEGDLATIPA